MCSLPNKCLFLALAIILQEGITCICKSDVQASENMRALIILCRVLVAISQLISVFGADNSEQITIIPPDWVTTTLLGEAKLQWVVVSGSFSNYSISKDGSSLGSNSYQVYDVNKGVITLYLGRILPVDAGYYILTVTPDPLRQTFVGKLFAYVPPSTTVTAGSRSPSLGDSIEISCVASSQSYPVEKRPQIIYYFWTHIQYGDFRNVSGGDVVLKNGDPLPGYSIKNDGRTLAIDSVQVPDTRGIGCSAQEYGSPFKSNIAQYLPTLTYRPYVYSIYPGRKTSVDLSSGSNLNWQISYYSNPSLTYRSNWTFVNKDGYQEDFPIDTRIEYSYVSFLRFVSSTKYYGNYSVTLNNSVGSTTVTIQVAEPGIPDTPANLTVQYMTHNVISLKWRRQYGNDGQYDEQTISVMLRDIARNTEIETKRNIISNIYPDTIFYTVFQSSIQPETDYEVSIWSSNRLGSSDVSKITFRTPKKVILTVTQETISIAVKSIIQSDALINVTSTYPEMAWLNVSCCVKDSALCSVKSYNVFNSVNQIVFDYLPDGDAFVFEFALFTGDFFTYVYTLASVRDVCVPKRPGDNTTCANSNYQCSDKSPSTDKTNPVTDKANAVTDKVNTAMDEDKSATDRVYPFLVAVIVLAVLLGVALLFLIGCLVYTIVKSRSGNRPRNSNQRLRELSSVDSTKEETI